MIHVGYVILVTKVSYKALNPVLDADTNDQCIILQGTPLWTFRHDITEILLKSGVKYP
jgi:hypothetical protein